MPIVSPVQPTDAPITIRKHFEKGAPGPLTGTLAHVPELLQTALPFIGSALGASAVDFRTKEIVILRSSALNQCRYCVNTHTVVADKAGLSRDELRALRLEKDYKEIFSCERERTLIQWTDVTAQSSSPFSAELRANMAQHFTESQIVELTITIGATVMLNRYATALELPVSTSHHHWLMQEELVY